jgi:hypothetical protein
MKLSDTALIVLGNAANREDRMVPRRPKSPPIVDTNACRALVKTGLMETTSLPGGGRVNLVTVKEDDRPMGFRITDAGFHAINQTPPGATQETPPTDATTAPHAPTDDAVAQDVNQRGTGTHSQRANGTHTGGCIGTIRRVF